MFARLPKSLTTVTTFSKLLALFLFILFPFFGFYVGMKYQEKLDAIQNSHTIPIQQVFVTPIHSIVVPYHCTQTDARFCSLEERLVQKIDSENYEEVIKSISPRSITCVRSASGILAALACKDKPVNSVVQGYPIIRNQGEGSIYSQKDAVAFITEYIQTHGPFSYGSTIIINDKALTVLSGRSSRAENRPLLGIGYKKYNGQWEPVTLIDGYMTPEFINLQPSSLDFIHE